MTDTENRARQALVGKELPRIRDAHAYGIVLLLVVILFIFSDTASSAPWTATVILILQGITLAVALSTSERSDVRLGARGIILVAAVVAVVQLTLEQSRGVTGAVALFSAGLIVAIGVVVALGVMRQTEVNAASVCGAIVIYLLIGMFFVFLYGSVQAIGGKHFFAQGVSGDRPLFLYFSYITMATVGYGDYTPATQVGKTLAVSEALLGQLYLVTIVAVLVSSFGRVRQGR